MFQAEARQLNTARSGSPLEAARANVGWESEGGLPAKGGCRTCRKLGGVPPCPARRGPPGERHRAFRRRLNAELRQRIACTTGTFDARRAGKNPPTIPMTTAKISPASRSVGVIRKLN